MAAVALGQADGTLAEPVVLPIASVVSYLRADADFNGDATPDPAGGGDVGLGRATARPPRLAGVCAG